jgi:hypothetical protein
MTSLNGNSYPYFDETKQYQFGTLDSGNTAFMLAVTGKNIEELIIFNAKLVLCCLCASHFVWEDNRTPFLCLIHL